jgi:hypothetical protein
LEWRDAVSLLCDAIRYSPGALCVSPSTNPAEFELSLHIACEYSIPYNTVEEMIRNYSTATSTKRRCPVTDCDLYPFQILQATHEELSTETELVDVKEK